MALGRFVVETHGHITTLYENATGESPAETWTGLVNGPGDGEVEPVDNSGLTLWDMNKYGVDMVLLYPSMIGTTNESQLALCDKYPDKFRAFCSDQKTKLHCHRTGEAWTLQAAADEIEAALKTGRYIGIGEFVPREWNPNKWYTMEERFEEYSIFFALAEKYNVPIAYHDLQWQEVPFDPFTLLWRLITKFPKVKIVINHGGQSIGNYIENDARIRKCLNLAGMYTNRGESNVFLEVGTWNADMIKTAIYDPNVGPTQLLWGSDYGHVPQYITTDYRRNGHMPISFTACNKRWAPVPAYQLDWWGWMSTEMEKVKQEVSQDEVNLILGGNAAKLFKLPVPYERMFLCGRPDVNGIDWKESIPYIPLEQVINLDDKNSNRALIEERKKNPPNWNK